MATLGRLVDVVLHDGRQPVAAIGNEALLGRESIDERKTGKSQFLEELHQRFVVIETQDGVLATVFRRMEPFGGRKRGKPKQLYLEKIIADAFAVYATILAKLGINIHLPELRTLVRVDEAEIQEVIVNLLDNSVYWLQHVDRRRREISVEVTRVPGGEVQVTFVDSGPGVSRENRNLIFEPYFSTKPNGIGLGLSIAGEIVSDYYDGRLELLDTGQRSGAAFRFTLRKRV